MLSQTTSKIARFAIAKAGELRFFPYLFGQPGTSQRDYYARTSSSRTYKLGSIKKGESLGSAVAYGSENSREHSDETRS